MTKREEMKWKQIEDRIASGQIIDQKSWKYIMELNSYSNEQLDHVALISGERNYTYRQMFRKWEDYAEVFSAMGMTGENHCRVGLMSGIGAESLIAYYSLNMTGASVSMIPFFTVVDEELLENLITEEGITDLVVSDAVTAILGTVAIIPMIIRKLMKKKEKLGLSNIIVLHVPIEGSFADDRLSCESKWIRKCIKDIPKIVLMEDLLEKYEAGPIHYDTFDSKDCSLIIHTSGTTRGISKPVPFSDRKLNAAVDRFMKMEMTREFRSNVVTPQLIELAGSYGMIDMVHLPLAFGGTVVMLPQGATNPKLSKAIGYYRMNLLFINTLILDQIMKLPIQEAPDLSSMKLIALGGSYLSAEKKTKYNTYIKERGGRVRITNGYGLSEAGAACILAHPAREDDAIGYPMPDVAIKIFDEEENKFYSIEDGPRTGGLYLSCPSISEGRIDDKVFFETDEIDGMPYLCTYDLVHVNEDGSLTAMGRMNRFFLNEEGERFDSGIVENAMAARPGILECAVVPEYAKHSHDTVPVLYIKTDRKGPAAAAIVKNALVHLFIREDFASSMNLPDMAVIADEIPYNTSGKVDIHEIMKGKVKGERYKTKPVFHMEKLIDIRLIPIRGEEEKNVRALIRPKDNNKIKCVERG